MTGLTLPAVLTPRKLFMLLAVGVFTLVGSGMFLQQLYHLNPCPLCIFQRVLYLVLGTVGVIAALLPQTMLTRRIMLGVVLAIAVTGFCTAAYQTWMQAFPELVNECSYTDPNLIEQFVDWLGMQYPEWFMATGFCTSKEWVFLGLSLANWSLVCFSATLFFVWVVWSMPAQQQIGRQ
jgi:disulfide bond formation protein DsbB